MHLHELSNNKIWYKPIGINTIIIYGVYFVIIILFLIITKLTVLKDSYSAHLNAMNN